jgi:hypothetical protein
MGIKSLISERPGYRPPRGTGVIQLIQTAEKYIGKRRYQLAIEQLTVAQKLEPENTYIQAIIDRVNDLRNKGQSDSYPLSVTVGPEFKEGIRTPEDETPLTPKDLEVQIRHLTTVAENFLEKHSYENAFDTLMKAYLLDPMSPYVIACERIVLPAWERVRNKKNSWQPDNPTGTPSPFSSISSTERKFMSESHSDGFDHKAKSKVPPAENASAQKQLEQRLEFLKQQKELERKEKERSIWRRASKTSNLFGAEDAQPPETDKQSEPKPTKYEGLFSKLRRGKFLG